MQKDRDLNFCKRCQKAFKKESRHNYFCKRCKRLANKRLLKEVTWGIETPKNTGKVRIDYISMEQGK